MEKEFNIEGMNCEHCVKAIETELNKLELTEIQVKIGSLKVEFDPAIVSNEEIENSIKNAGYKVVD
jgi:copper chaperone